MYRYNMFSPVYFVGEPPFGFRRGFGPQFVPFYGPGFGCIGPNCFNRRYGMWGRYW